jgi:hypothetical protein
MAAHLGVVPWWRHLFAAATSLLGILRGKPLIRASRIGCWQHFYVVLPLEAAFLEIILKGVVGRWSGALSCTETSREMSSDA